MLWLLASMWFALAGLFHLFSIVLTQYVGGSVGLRKRPYLLGGHPRIKPIRADFEQSEKRLPGECSSCRCRTAELTSVPGSECSVGICPPHLVPLFQNLTTRGLRRLRGLSLPQFHLVPPSTTCHVQWGCLIIRAWVVWVIDGLRKFDIIIIHGSWKW